MTTSETVSGTIQDDRRWGRLAKREDPGLKCGDPLVWRYGFEDHCEAIVVALHEAGEATGSVH